MFKGGQLGPNRHKISSVNFENAEFEWKKSFNAVLGHINAMLWCLLKDAHGLISPPMHAFAACFCLGAENISLCGMQ